MYIIFQCELEKKCTNKNDDIDMLYFFIIIFNFLRCDYIQYKYIILRTDAFITENAKL